VIGILGGAYYINQKNLKTYQKLKSESQQNLIKLSQVKNDIAKYNANLKTAESVLENKKKTTTLIANLSSILPPGVVLSGISFNVESIDEPVIILAQAKSFKKAGVLKRNFEKSTLFDEVTLQQITEENNNPASQDSPYPFNVQLQVILSEDATKEQNKNKGGAI
jgi:Tfp pilus assembly protein PilN